MLLVLKREDSRVHCMALKRPKALINKGKGLYMPRRKKKILKRDIGVDPRYGSQMIQKLINIVMERGKKNVARDNCL